MILERYEPQFDYDCMTLTGRTIYEYLDGGAAGVASLAHLACNLTLDSATLAAESGYEYESVWMTRQKTNMMLADLYDLVASFAHLFASSKSKKRQQKPEPYPRPWAKKRQARKIGKKPIRASNFAAWWNSKRK